MKPELLYLVYATILTGLLWIPYVLDRFATWGISDTVGYPEAPNRRDSSRARIMMVMCIGFPSDSFE